jgi:mRNA interferase RelE/StbE
MASFRLEWRASVHKDLRKVPPEANVKIVAAALTLVENPFPSGVKKLSGCQSTFRIRVGDYRIIYEVHASESLVMVQRVRHRKDAYRD